MTEIPNLRHLWVFSQVVGLGSISAAALHEHLSQPAVSQAITKLEETLGTPLVERQRSSMTATPIGAMYLARVRSALTHLQLGAREAVRLGQRRGNRGFTDFYRLMTAAQLRVLAAMMDSRNFTIAAGAIGISQPSVHRSARNIEKLSGLTLFIAAREGVTLSPAALILGQRAKLALVELRQGDDEIKTYLGQDSTRIVLGSMPLARTEIVPDAVSEMVHATRKVQVRVVDGPYEELLRGLRYGDIDCLIGALRNPPPIEDIAQEPLFDDPLAIVAGPQHPLVGRTNVPIEETLKFPWIAPPRATPAGSYLFDTLRIGDLPQTPVRVVSSSLVLLRGLLVRGDFISIISLHQVSKELEIGMMVPLDVRLSGNTRPIGLTYRRDWRPTQTQARFIDLLRAASGRIHAGAGEGLERET